MHADIATGQGKGIDRGLVHDEKSERETAILGIGNKFLADILDVLVDFRIFNQISGCPQAAKNRATNLAFHLLGKDSIGGTADVRQITLLAENGASKKRQHGGAQHQAGVVRKLVFWSCHTCFSRSL